MSKETIVHEGDAQWHRPAYLKLVGNQVVFDCSDGEYGPIKFDIETLRRAMYEHANDEDLYLSDWDVTLLDGLDDE